MHHMQNNYDQRMMFKVKLSNIDDYRVYPVFGFDDASSNTNAEVIRKSRAPRNDTYDRTYMANSAEDGPIRPCAIDVQAAFENVQNVPNEDVFIININAS